MYCTEACENPAVVILYISCKHLSDTKLHMWSRTGSYLGSVLTQHCDDLQVTSCSSESQCSQTVMWPSIQLKIEGGIVVGVNLLLLTPNDASLWTHMMFPFSYLCSMIKQQCYSISVAQVSVDTQQGGVVEDIATVIHISPGHNQQSAHLQEEKRKVTAELWWEIHSCVSVSMHCYLDIGGVEVAQWRKNRAQTLGAVWQPQPLQNGGGNP